MTEILRFQLYGQKYGIPIADAEEILRAVAITPLPNAPEIIEGVINVHGAVTPVLNLRARFGLPAQAVLPSDHLIVARAGGRQVIIRADQVDGLFEITDDDVAPVTSITSKADYISGVAKLPDGLVLLHDLHTFLSAAEGQVLDDALAGHA